MRSSGRVGAGASRGELTLSEQAAQAPQLAPALAAILGAALAGEPYQQVALALGLAGWVCVGPGYRDRSHHGLFSSIVQ